MQAAKRQAVQASTERLQVGLAKLTKTQKDVDVLVEQARVMAVEVEQKVAAASRFAEEVGVEKEKVNAENAAAQVEADACATIAREVTELQARCESELAAAEPLVAQAQEALDTLTKKDLGGWGCSAQPAEARSLGGLATCTLQQARCPAAGVSAWLRCWGGPGCRGAQGAAQPACRRGRHHGGGAVPAGECAQGQELGRRM